VKTAGNIMNAAIDLVLAVVDGMWTIFETPLNIPVLSPLYHQITNNDLTLLDVVCLILAIPATLTYKLIKNQAPFPASTTTDILKSGSWDQMRALFNGSSWNYRELSQDGAALSTDSNLGVDSDQVKHILIIFMNATAAFSTYVFSIVTIFKVVTQDLPAGTETINVIHTVLFYCSTAPNITAALLRNNQQSWDVILGECIYGITVLQKFADIFLYNAEWKAIWGQPTKWLDCFLGISSMLTVAIPFSVNDIKNPKVADRLFLSCFTNSFWNLNRVCTPWVDKNTQSGMAVFSTKVLLIIVYGAGQLILAVEEGKNPK
jgi:hypothetical protein